MALDFVTPVTSPAADAAADSDATFSWSDTYQKYSYFGLLGLVGLLTYSYWNTLSSTAAFWEDPQYSHGYLVPLIAIYIAWAMRPNPAAHQPPEGESEATFLGVVPASTLLSGGVAAGVAGIAAGYYLKMPLVQGLGIAALCLAAFAYVLIGQPFQRISAGERWTGLAILVGGYALRLVAATYYSEPLDRYSLLIALLGAFVMIGGWALVRWAGAAIGFLFFMYPIPSAIEQPLLLGLQKLAAVASEVVLTILSQPVIREGNKIIVDGLPMEVAEACSGLRMLTIFGGFAVACALLIRRPWWDRLIVLLSAVPIALVVNVTRIVVTALLYRLFPDSEAIHQVIHDYGWSTTLTLDLLATAHTDTEGGRT